MAKSVNNISNFLAEVSQRGLAKPNRFEVIIDKPPCITNNVASRITSMFVDQAHLPMIQILTTTQRLYGTPSFHPNGVDHGGGSFGMTFNVDRLMNVKTYFDQWVDGIIDRNTYHANYQSNYLTNMTVKQLDENDSVTYQVRILDVFPVAVNMLTLDHSLSNTVHKLSVNFNYRRWEYLQLTPDPVSEITKSDPVPRIILQQGQIANNLSPKLPVTGGNETVGLVNKVNTFFRFK